MAARGVLCVVSAGNAGSRATLESPNYPGALPDVICVGSHDGAGSPSAFSSNGPAVDILADGEGVPRPGFNGTSFAAPRVAATVTHVQAIVDGLTGDVLGTAQMIDVLQQGGAGPRSRPDPADGRSRYFLHDHDGSLDYAWSRYGGTPTRALEYVASNRDLIDALGASAAAGSDHFEHHGSVEQRAITFDGLDYIASYGDLIRAFGADGGAGAGHFIRAGSREGRSVTFDGLEYIAERHVDRADGVFGAVERVQQRRLDHAVGEARAVRGAYLEVDHVVGTRHRQRRLEDEVAMRVGEALVRIGVAVMVVVLDQGPLADVGLQPIGDTIVHDH